MIKDILDMDTKLITITDIHNYCQVGYKFLVQMTDTEGNFGIDTKFYIVGSKIDAYDDMCRIFYIDESEFLDYNMGLDNDNDYNRDDYLIVGLYVYKGDDSGLPYNFKVLKVEENQIKE